VTEFSEINALFQQVDKAKPNPSDIEKLREVLTKYPALSQLGGNLTRQVETQILMHACPTQQSARISIEQYCAHLRDQWGYESATPLERTLIEHIVLCWLRFHITELRYESNMQDNLTLPQADYWERKLSMHQTRYLRAVETLARIRKLGVNVQINVARRQIVNR